MQKMTKDYLLELVIVGGKDFILRICPVTGSGKKKEFPIVIQSAAGWLKQITNSDAAYLFQMVPDHTTLNIDKKCHISIQRGGVQHA